MPRLLVFVPCFSVSLGSHDNTASVLSIIENMNLETVPAVDQSLSRDWYVFTLWKREAGEADKEFSQEMTYIAPSGQEIAMGAVEFKMGKEFQRNIIHMNQMPIGENGQYTINIVVTSKETNQTVATASYPIAVIHPKNAGLGTS